MSQRFVCPRGHHWTLSVEGHAPEGLAWLLCPVCGTRPLADGDTPPESPPAADVLHPGYEILGELGRGGMGVVYRARSRSLGRLVALKMNLSDDAHVRPYLHREAEALARLQHPNIVQIFEVGEHDGRPFLAIELVEGGSLHQKLAGQPQPPRAAAELVETLARTVHYVHERGLVHRNLKPHVVLLAPQPGSAYGVPKLADFGLVKRLAPGKGPDEPEGTVVGTPAYMAAEQAAARNQDIGPAADVYGLGAILYEMLTGRSPFRGNTVLDTLQQVMSQEPVPPSRMQPGVPRDLEAICLKCLQKEPQKRYASALALAEDLRRFLDGEPVRACPLGPAERLLRWAKRGAVAGLLVLALLAALTANGVAVGLWYNQQLQAALVEREDAMSALKQSLRMVEQARMEAEVARMEALQERQRAEEALKAAHELKPPEKP